VYKSKHINFRNLFLELFTTNESDRKILNFIQSFAQNWSNSPKKWN